MRFPRTVAPTFDHCDVRFAVIWIGFCQVHVKKGSERYETAADLARDVKHYLDGQPIEAVGPNLGYRTRKFVRKHRASMSIAAVILLTLISATIISTVFAIKATNSSKLASLRLEQVDRARKEAETERDRALAAETKLEELVEKSQLETAHARALEKLNRNKEKPSNVMVLNAHNQSNHDSRIVWTHGESSGTHVRYTSLPWERPRSQVSPNVEVVEIESTKDDDSSRSDAVHRSQTYRVFLNDTGDIVVNHGKWDADNEFTFEQDHGDANQVVVIRDKAETKRFLQLLADERREKFGPRHAVVADAIFEIGNMSFDDQDWSDAENQFREYRDILNAHSDNEAQIAKVELLIGKAQLHQEKHAQAMETLKNGVKRIVRLGNVSDELVDAMEDIKMNITIDHIGEVLPEDLHRELLKKLELHKDKEHNVEITNSKETTN